MGRPKGRPSGEGSPYLLVGLLTCGVCGGGMEVLSSASGGRRVYHYRCYVARRKGAAVCTNKLPAPMAETDRAVLEAVEETLLNSAVVERALAHAEAAIARDRSAERREMLEAELAAQQAAIRRLTAAIVAGGELSPFVTALDTYERQRHELEARLAALSAPTTLDAKALRRQLKGYLADWQGLLHPSVQLGQQALRRLVVGRLTFAPQADGYYKFSGKVTVRPLLCGIVRNVASPTGSTRAWTKPIP